MRILQVVTRYYPALGGGQKHVYQLAKYLALDGHDVTVYTTSSMSTDDVCSFSLRPPFITTHHRKADPPKKEVRANTVVKRYNLKCRYWSLNWIPEMWRDLKRTTMDFDIVHAHGYNHSAALASCYYANKFKKPFVLTAHDLAISSSLPADAQLFYKLYERTFGQYLLKNSTQLIALTEAQVGEYAERGGDARKISIIPNGIELDAYTDQKPDLDLLSQYGISSDRKILLFVGRLAEYKGIQDVIAVMPQILESFPETRFIVAGEDFGYKRRLEDLIAQYNLDASVLLTGPLSEQKLAQLYKAASALVFPSSMEGFGLVLLEAMASGTLCIAYSLPAVRRIIQNGMNGILVSNKSELLDRILYYFTHPGKKAQIEKAALRSVSAYDIRQIVKATEQVYERCIR